MRNRSCYKHLENRAANRKWLFRIILLVIFFLIILFAGFDGIFGQNESAYIDLVQRLEIDRYDLGQPAGFTADSTDGALYLLTQDHMLHSVSAFGVLQESVEMPVPADLLAYDPHSKRMLVFDALRQMLFVRPLQQGVRKSGLGREQLTTVPLAAFGVTGFTIDPVSGDLYLLSSSSRLERYATAGLNKQAAQIRRLASAPLPKAQTDLQGLAFDPATRHLFSYDPRLTRLVELTPGGRQVAIYDLSPFNLPQNLSLTFAPSSDQSDDPAVSSLFVAGGGNDGDIWEFTFTTPEPVPAAAAAATLVQTIQTWQFTPPSPDASGATYLPFSNTILETDSEVNEKPIYQGANQFEISLDGILQTTYTTLAFSDEPTGITYDPSRNHLFLSHDNDHKVDEVDLNYQHIKEFDVQFLDGKEVDAEGIAYDSVNDRLYIAGGISQTIFWIDPGPDGDFGTADDTNGSFAAEGLADPEGVTFNSDNGNIYAVGKEDVVAEYTATGIVVQYIDISAADAHKPAGMAYGPSSTGGGSKSIWVTDRGVDADSGINGGLGDGRIYEFALGLPDPPPAPAANFSGSPTTGPYPMTVNFSNLSSGLYDTCSWDFGDTGTSTDCNDPSHTYTSAGAFTVSLSVEGPGGSSAKTETNFINVVQPVVADFNGAPTEIIAPDTVDFFNTSSGAYDTCSWDFGDDGSSAQCADPSHIYTTTGTYTVSLTVMGPGGTDTRSVVDYVTVNQATVDFSATPRGGPSPLNVTFDNLSQGHFETCLWDFGDGTTSSTCGPLDHIYASKGMYTVELTMSGPAGSLKMKKENYVHVDTYFIHLPLLTKRGTKP